MAGFRDYPFVKKVVALIVALWTVACVCMYWSMHDSSPRLLPVFLVLYFVPTGMILGLLAISRWHAAHEPLQPAPKRGARAPAKGKKT
jgi:hypothetical protein